MTTLGEPITQTGSASASPEYRWSADAFLRAIDAGVFETPERLELIHGRITDLMAQGALHLACRARTARRLRRALEPALYVIEECSIQITSDGVPVVDVVVLRGTEGDYDTRLPSEQDAVLLVEVAVTSAEYDLGEKALLYAQAGIGDYWVVLPGERAVVVHRDPGPSGYGSVTRLDAAATLAPLVAPEVPLAVRDLLGPAGEQPR